MHNYPDNYFVQIIQASMSPLWKNIEMSELCESQSELGINVRLDGSPYHR